MAPALTQSAGEGGGVGAPGGGVGRFQFSGRVLGANLVLLVIRRWVVVASRPCRRRGGGKGLRVNGLSIEVPQRQGVLSLSGSEQMGR